MAEAEWSSSGLETIEIALCPAGQPLKSPRASFWPEYLEQFFGEGQSIFGYRDLEIKLRFAAHDLYPNINIQYAEKYKAVGETKATDLLKVFKDFLIPDAFETTERFTSRLQDAAQAESWEPPGKLLASYQSEGREFEIWHGGLDQQPVRTMIDRIQILIPMFIDGGILINLEDQDWTLARWHVFLIFEKLPAQVGSSKYSIVGYSTAYRFPTYKLHDAESSIASQSPSLLKDTIAVSSLPNKTRISQALILPPYRGQNHGSHLYDTMIETFLAEPACLEVTVEDPNESFDDLRDLRDLYRLRKTEPRFTSLLINTTLNPNLTAAKPGVRVPTAKLLSTTATELEVIRKAQKLAPRQFARLVELQLLSTIPITTRQGGLHRLTRRAAATDPDDRALYYWRLLVKQRIYRQNRDLLIQLDSPERIEKLEETMESQAHDYERLVDKVKTRLEQPQVDGEEPAKGSSGVRSGKRKVVDDDDDEDPEVDENEDGDFESGPSRKRARG